MEMLRYSSQPVECLRGSNQRIIRGTAAVFYNPLDKGTEYNLYGNTFERLSRSAFDKVLKEQNTIWAVDNHDMGKRFARTPNSLKLWTDQHGLRYEANLNNSTKANDVWENSESNLYQGSSFRFDIDLNDPSQVQWTREGDKSILNILSVEKLVEVSPVYDPAYKATDCGAIQRSQENWIADIETQKRLKLLESMSINKK